MVEEDLDPSSGLSLAALTVCAGTPSGTGQLVVRMVTTMSFVAHYLFSKAEPCFPSRMLFYRSLYSKAYK